MRLKLSNIVYWLARRMAGPLRLLEEGVERVREGQFDHRIVIRTGDELERLATRINEMAGELALSQERSKRIARLKRFLAPQVAELVDRTSDDSVLDSQQVEVVALFCDLRGFTAFSSRAEPEEILRVLSEYHDALGAMVTKHEATLTSFLGDGLMVLVNAPVPRTEPAAGAVELAVDMQNAVQELILTWRARGYPMGFGIGLAMGLATVGRIGTRNRLEYTAIGSVVNLASRLCSSAEDRQILVDRTIADAISQSMRLLSLGTQALKGFAENVPVFSVPFDQDVHGPTPQAGAAG